MAVLHISSKASGFRHVNMCVFKIDQLNARVVPSSSGFGPSSSGFVLFPEKEPKSVVPLRGRVRIKNEQAIG
jgi:hypothetical protein